MPPFCPSHQFDIKLLTDFCPDVDELPFALRAPLLTCLLAFHCHHILFHLHTTEVTSISDCCHHVCVKLGHHHIRIGPYKEKQCGEYFCKSQPIRKICKQKFFTFWYVICLVSPVPVRFQEATYTVSESEGASVTITLIAEVSPGYPFTVTVTPRSDTARGECTAWHCNSV